MFRFPFLPLAFTVIGSIALCVGLGVAVPRWQHLAHAQRVDGTVVGYEYRWNSSPCAGDGGRAAKRSATTRGSHYPVVEYSVNGETYRIQGRFGSSRSGRTGKTVAVAFLPEDPASAVVDTFLESWAITLLIGGIGLVFASFGVIGLIRPVSR